MVQEPMWIPSLGTEGWSLSLGGVCDQCPVSQGHGYFRRTPSVSAEVLSADQASSPEAGYCRPPRASVLGLCLQSQ